MQTRRPASSRLRLAVGLAALMLVGAACGDDAADVGAGSTTAPSASSSTLPASSSSTGGVSTTPTSTGTCPPTPDAGTDPVEGPAPQNGPSLLAGVSASGTACGDVVQFLFASPTAPPGFRASYQPGPFYLDPSGQEVAIAGDAFLVVRLDPAATADLTLPEAPSTYNGPKVIAPTGSDFVTEVHLIGDFEGVVTWVIGLRATRPFVATTVPGPVNLTISFPKD